MIADFVARLRWDDVPPQVQARLQFLLRDFVACSAAGGVTPAARLAADYATAQHPGDAATILFDGRRAAPTGAAFANAVLADALDFDDGHRLAKGHPGAIVIPAALAVAEATGAAPEEFAAAVAAGYEVAVRAAIELHAVSGEYHASGAWGAVGAAAAAARLLELDPATIRHALGLAQYHAPLAPIMRSVGDPAMTKDACGWGAAVGVSSASLAQSGFTAVESSIGADGLGDRWELLEVYVKKFPCCRWSQPAIEAALALRAAAAFEPSEITGVRVRTFAAAAALARRLPGTTEEAQYSLVWPVSAALASGSFEVEHVLPPAFADPTAARLMSILEIDVDAQFEDAFPARRLSDVSVEVASGIRYESGPMEAPGEPDDPQWEEIVAEKAAAFPHAPTTLDPLLLGSIGMNLVVDRGRP